jgi:hypothetical protein
MKTRFPSLLSIGHSTPLDARQRHRFPLSAGSARHAPAMSATVEA